MSDKKKLTKKKKILSAAAASVFGAGALFYYSGQQDNTEHQSYDQFVDKAKNGAIVKVVEKGTRLEGYTEEDGEKPAFYSNIPAEENAYESVKRDGLTYDAQPDHNKTSRIVIGLLPTLIFIGLIVYLVKKTTGTNIMGSVKNRKPTEKITFDDIAGQDEAKEQVRGIVKFLKNPKEYKKLGGKVPKGALMTGGPGLGKTMLAKAIAHEAGVPFFSHVGSDFVKIFAGAGPGRVRKAFAEARKQAPCVMFIDEIDAVGRNRNGGSFNDEGANTLNALLDEMNGMDASADVIVIAATNRPDILDPALTRPGRLDRKIHMIAPDRKGRRAILGVHAKGKPIASDANLDTIASLTPQASGADLANIINEASLLAANDSRSEITKHDLEEALELQMMGPPRLSLELSKKDRERIAYHEAGHVITLRHSDSNETLHKVTIVPRGPGGGVTWMIPPDNTIFHTVGDIKNKMIFLAGGRCAELKLQAQQDGKELNLQDAVSNGASNDIQLVTNMITTAITEWGASDKLGFVQYSNDNCDAETAAMIANETRLIVGDAYKESQDIIEQNWHEVEKLAQALLAQNTLSAEDVENLLKPDTPQQKTAIPKPS